MEAPSRLFSRDRKVGGRGQLSWRLQGKHLLVLHTPPLLFPQPHDHVLSRILVPFALRL